MVGLPVTRTGHLDLFLHGAPSATTWLDGAKWFLPLLVPTLIAAASWLWGRREKRRVAIATISAQISNLTDSVKGEVKHLLGGGADGSWFVVLPYLDREVFPFVTTAAVPPAIAEQAVRIHFSYRAALARISLMGKRRPTGEGVDDIIEIDFANDIDKKNYEAEILKLQKLLHRACAALSIPTTAAATPPPPR